MTRQEIVALFTRRDRDYNRRDAPALAADHAEDAVAISPIQGRLDGRARIQEAYQLWFSAFGDLVFTTDEIVIDGHRVVQFVTIAGKQTGPFGGLPATGRKFQITGAWLHTLDEAGRIIKDRRVYDVTNMLVQLGALRTKPVD